ncbi:MAG: ferredoxin-type protein NapF [Epsilonproteobacteria bacterium]|nr:ferredoxin-type protein NapF [Campylobacterota bacterium]
MQKREFFSSLASSFKGNRQESFNARPPYFNDKNSFLENCKNCDGKCAFNCEENIIVIKEDRTPILDFSKGGCTYCDKCAQACEFGILDIEYKKNIYAKLTINILQCLSWQKTICFSCKEACLDDAIVYLGLFRPEIDMEKCTSCGFCVNVCPANAIEVKKWQ